MIIKTILLSATALVAVVSTCNDKKNTSAESKEDILIRIGEWKLDEVARNTDGTNSHYKRGGENTTGVRYDAVRIKFKKGGSGSYTTDMGDTHSMQWRFTNADKDDMIITVDYGNFTEYHWMMTEVNTEFLYNTTAIRDLGNDILVTARYIPAN